MAKSPFQQYIVAFDPGERIFTEGDIGTTMFVVQSGSVRLFREQDAQGKQLGTMEKGDFFGEMSVLEALPRTHSAEAIEKCELIEINSMTFDRMIRGNIEIAVRMLRKLSIRLRRSEKAIEELQQEIAARAPVEVPAGVSEMPAGSAGAVEPPAERPAIPQPEVAPPEVAAYSPASSHPSPPQTVDPVAAGLPGTATEEPAPLPPEIPAAPSDTAEPLPPAPEPPVPAEPPRPGPPAPDSEPPPAHKPLSFPAPTRPVMPAATSPRGQRRGPRLSDDSGNVIFPLSETESLIGRYDPVTETEPEVDLTPLDIKRSVSRRHARITVANGNFFITEEIGALNGTFVNGSRLATGRPSPLKEGDRVALGTVELVFHL
jgi:hypothetical protein